MDYYKIIITPEAEKDLIDLYNYICYKLESPSGAKNVNNRILDYISNLSTFPNRYPIMDFEPARSMGIHRCVVGNYIICYVIIELVVYITDILYAKANIIDKIKTRHM